MRRLLHDDELLAQIETDWRDAVLSQSRTAMLDYSVKLSRSPDSMSDSDVDALRAVGFSDRDILDIVEVTAYCAYANRIADGLGVSQEPWIDAGPE